MPSGDLVAINSLSLVLGVRLSQNHPVAPCLPCVQGRCSAEWLVLGEWKPSIPALKLRGGVLGIFEDGRCHCRSNLEKENWVVFHGDDMSL